MLSPASRRRAKRALDLGLCICALPLALPFAGVAAAAVKVEDRGPILYRGPRIGRDGSPFHILKFRTMVVDDAGPRVTRAGDPRITAVGRVLRRTKLDEVPQLLNVLRGEMSFVGPRPEDPRYVAHYTDEQREVLAVPPGLTGAAVLRYRDEQGVLEAARPADVERYYLEQLMPAKLALELAYVRRWSLREDLGILVRTMGLVLS